MSKSIIKYQTFEDSRISLNSGTFDVYYNTQYGLWIITYVCDGHAYELRIAPSTIDYVVDGSYKWSK